jgi:transcription termination factor NusB
LAERRRPHTSTTASPGAEPRAAAARALHAVLDRGQSLTRVLQTDPTRRTPADQALVQEMVYGALRLLPRLRLIAGRLLERPLKPRDGDLQALILIGLYQLGFMKTPSHAAVSATVEATRLLGKPRMAGLVNALLRRFQREQEASAGLDRHPARVAPALPRLAARTAAHRLAGRLGVDRIWPATSARPWPCASIRSGGRARTLWPNWRPLASAHRPSMDSIPASCSISHVPCANFQASMQAGSRSKTAAHNWPRVCSTPSPASGCSTPVPRPAARRRPFWNVPVTRSIWLPSTATRRA